MMKLQRSALSLGLVALLGAPGACDSNAPAPAASGPAPPASAPSPPASSPSPAASGPAPTIDASYSAAQNAFGFKLFTEIAGASGDRNVLVSPSSVAVALAMTLNGARGETKRSMEQALRLGEMSLEDVNAAASAWLKAIEEPTPRVELAVANSIWTRAGVPLEPAFLRSVETGYGATVSALDFAAPDAAGRINDWVKKETNGRIPDIVASPISADKVVFLINALAFKGKWTTPFDPQRTHPAPFTLRDGSAVNVPMMSRTDQFEVKEGEGFSALRLPYGDGRFSMVVILPREGGSVHDLSRQLGAEAWSAWTTGFTKQRVQLMCPTFTFRSDITLNDALKALGMSDAFAADRADFGAMVEPSWLGANRLFISEVKHRTFIEVNEEGTEASAATSVGMSVTSMPPTFAIDRPFLMAIEDGSTSSVVFLGRVMDPRSTR